MLSIKTEALIRWKLLQETMTWPQQKIFTIWPKLGAKTGKKSAMSVPVLPHRCFLYKTLWARRSCRMLCNRKMGARWGCALYITRWRFGGVEFSQSADWTQKVIFTQLSWEVLGGGGWFHADVMMHGISTALMVLINKEVQMMANSCFADPNSNTFRWVSRKTNVSGSISTFHCKLLLEIWMNMKEVMLITAIISCSVLQIKSFEHETCSAFANMLDLLMIWF